MRAVVQGLKKYGTEHQKETLRPQAFRALEVLIRNHGRLVDYGQMIREAVIPEALRVMN